MSGLLVLSAILIFSILSVSIVAIELLTYDDSALDDGPCAFPAPIPFPENFLVALRGLPQGFKLYSPIANAVYFRWMYEKVTNQAATTQAQLESLKPRITFPDISALMFSLSAATVEVFDPTTASYHARCIPNNLFMTNATCDIVDESPGCAPYGFGGSPICTTLIWSDSTAFAEWHCLDGGHQMFNVISLNPTLTPGQITEVQNVVTEIGFKADNFVYQTYSQE